MRHLEGAPLPDVHEWDTREWWAHVKQHRLVVQRCTPCGTFRHPPMPVCHACHSFEYEWHPVSGKGVVFSYIIAHHAPSAVYRDLVPYNVVMVELPDAGNVRIVGNLLDVPLDDIEVGMAVEVAFEDVNNEVTLTQWRLAQ